MNVIYFLFTGFPRQEYWSGLPSRLQEIFPHPGVEPTSLMSPALVSGFFTTSAAKSMPEERKECTPSLRTGGMNTLTPSEKNTQIVDIEKYGLSHIITD